MNESDARKAAFTRLNYPPGTRLVLDHMDDPYAVPSGTKGTVQMVDDRGHVNMIWDNGRSLSLVPGVDSFHKVTEQDMASRQELAQPQEPESEDIRETQGGMQWQM